MNKNRDGRAKRGGIDPWGIALGAGLLALAFVMQCAIRGELRQRGESGMRRDRCAEAATDDTRLARIAAAEEERVAEERRRARQPGEPTPEEERLAALEGLTDISTVVRDEPPRTRQ